MTGGSGADATPPSTARVVVVAASTVVRHGIRVLLERCRWVTIIGAVGTEPRAIETVSMLRPDLTVIDVGSSRSDSMVTLLDAARPARVILLVPTYDATVAGHVRRHAVDQVLVHGEFSDQEFLRAIEAQARRLTDAPPVHGFAHGGTAAFPSISDAWGRLSFRETEVMDNIARGLCNAEIASALSLTEKTVKNYINRIFAKLHVTTRARAIVLWLGHGRGGPGAVPARPAEYGAAESAVGAAR